MLRAWRVGEDVADEAVNLVERAKREDGDGDGEWEREGTVMCCVACSVGCVCRNNTWRYLSALEGRKHSVGVFIL